MAPPKWGVVDLKLAPYTEHCQCMTPIDKFMRFQSLYGRCCAVGCLNRVTDFKCSVFYLRRVPCKLDAKQGESIRHDFYISFCSPNCRTVGSTLVQSVDKLKSPYFT